MSEENSKTSEAAESIDSDALLLWMTNNIEMFKGPISVSKFPGGQSNPTFEIKTPEKKYVLRRKPAGKLVRGAHAVEREYRIMSALESTAIPVPHCFSLCEDDAVIGTPFFIMEKIEGRIFWDPTLPEVPIEEREGYYTQMVKVIADLHNVEYEKIGLEDYGKPGNYFARQINLWSKQYQQDDVAGRLDAMDRLCEWLPENIPDDGDTTTLVHGDYRCDNLIFHPDKPEIIAALDWELSTLGNPLADFTYHLMAYRTPKGLPSGMAGVDLVGMGLPSEEFCVDMYCQFTERDSIPDIDYYFAFNMWRLAAIIHGIKGRMLRGNASNDKASSVVSFLETLAECAWTQAEKTPST